MYNIDEEVKQRAYSSYIGFFAGSGLLKQVRLDKPGLVQLANELAIKGMACPEPPPMDKKVIGKMGLKGVPGFNYATGGDSNGRSAPRNRGNQNRGNQARDNQDRGNQARSNQARGNQNGNRRDALSPGAGQGGSRGGVEKSRGGRGGRAAA
jgi:ATP-dependent RNA helicase MSS116